ncbi:microtubule-associated protein futsch [Belonocnema kinseyi]|uniref:microtubule-associated protein futsch n=1 Tax=Belonocnema kinseyi TaxID=2817044 RepID=UPI00143D3F17|nr:microtubule-associated protein futsch [Belonocnema kinseyi]
MSTMDPAGDGGGGGDSGVDKNITVGMPLTHHQHPPPSPLSGCYLLVVLPEPHTGQHKDLILSRLAKGFLSWDKDSCHVDLEKELLALIAQAPEGEEARNGERLIQYATENLVTEVLIHPQTNTLLQCIRNLLASFTKHRHIIHAGYTYGGNGSWILQDGTFSYADFVDVFSEHEVQRVLHAYENSVTVDIHCAGVSEWSTPRLCKEPCTRSCQVKVNPDDVLTAGVPAITNFTHYIEQYLVPQTLEQLMEPSDVVGNIRFSHPTLYVFPGGQGDAALFGINGFNMLVDGGFARKACFWDFARHLDRLDAVLVTRINNSNIGGMSSVLRKKKEMHVYPQIGHFFCNLVERRHSNSPDGDKDIDPLILDLIDMGQEMMVNLRHISLRAHHCYRDPDPINLYHKVGHGTLDMFVLSPSKDSKEVREFLAKWHASDSKVFSGSHKKDSNNLVFPIQNVVSICALLVWQPANPEGTITRILFPGSTPQHKIFEGLDRLKHLEFLKYPTCSSKSLSPSPSLVALKDKPIKKMGLIEREAKKTELKKEKKETPEIKAVKGSDESPPKSVSQAITGGKTAKVEMKTRKVAENKKIESEAKESKKIEDIKEIKKKESARIEKAEKQDGEMKKTDGIKAETEKTAVSKEHKAKPEPKKRETRDTKTAVKTSKPEAPSKPSPKPIEKRVLKPSVDKKDIKSSPTTPKKTLNGTAGKSEMSKPVPKVPTKPATRAPYSAPAKSAKDANNRKVVEQKNIEMSSMAKTAALTAASKAAKPKPAERKPISRRTKPVSPSKSRVPSSPAKSTRSTPTTSVKSDKDGVIRKVKGDKGTTDSSTVSTPSGIEPDSVVRLAEKNLTEKSEDMSLDSIESKVLADLKEEREVVEEIEAVLQKAERIEEARKEERFEGDDEITAEATDKKEEDMTEEDVTAEIEDAPKKESSRKASQELTEEDEYLIVEKEEIYTEDSVLSGEGEQKHFLDEVESEKPKIVMDQEFPKEEEAEEKKDEVPEKKLEFAEASGINVQERRVSELLSPENKEKLKEEMKEIIATATEAVQKTDEKEDSGKKDSEDIIKEPCSLSPDKVDSSEKKTTETEQKTEVDQKEPVPEKMEESQERISTLESGATTTAPTLPEDERITLDEIKEVIDEKHVAEEVKENAVSPVIKEVIPEEIPAPVIRQSIPAHHRDSVKTPDEVADLPVHEEVDPKLYRMEDFGKDKDEKAQSPQETKEPPTPPVKEQKGMFSFFGKVADKFEKGYDKLTKKKRDSDKDTDDKSSSKSGSPKDPKPKEPAFEDVDMEKVFQKVSKVGDKPDTFEQVEPKLYDVKVATIKETATFLQEEIKDVGITCTLDSESKIECMTFDVVEAEKIIEQPKLDEKPSMPKDFEDLKDETLTEGGKKEVDIKEAATDEDIEALIQESSKKSKSGKDSLRDSLESLEEKGPREHQINLADLPPPTDIIADTLTGVAERLGEIKPPVDTVSAVSKEPEKSLTAPQSKELESAEDKEEDDLGYIPDLKEAVRDIGEVLAGTAGIELEEKPKDVIEIVKKVAEVLKEDDFLSEKALFEIAEKKERPTVLDTRPSTGDDKKSEVDDKVGKSSFGDIIPKKVGVTEQLPSQEEVEEMIEGEIFKPLPEYQRAIGIVVQEQPCIEVVKDTQVSSPANEVSERERILEIGADLLRDINICEQTGICDDSKVDVLEAGLEPVCTKMIIHPRADEADDTNEEIESSDIGFEQKLSPAKPELVVVTPGSTPTSPKFAADKISEHDVQVASRLADQLPADIRHVLEKGGNVEDIIEEILMSKKQKITTEIIEYIIIIKRISRERVIEIIETIILKRGISRESAMEGEHITKTEVVISPQKRNDVQDYIEKEYVNRGRRITTLIIEEITLLKIIPEDVLMEIIGDIIIKRNITRDSVLDIIDDKTQKISVDVQGDIKTEAPAVSGGTVDEQKQIPMTKVTEKKEISVAESTVNLEEDLIEGFVNIPSTSDVAAFISEERRTTYDELEFEARATSSGKTLPGKVDFEAIEEEYKVCGLTQSTDVSRKLIETEKGIEDTSEVIEADEKFVKETKGKFGKENESVLDEIKDKEEEMDSRVRDSEIFETSEVIDATEKYLDEAKEKVEATVKETDEKKSPKFEKALTETKVASTTVQLIEERKKSISDKVSGEVLSEALQEKIDDQEVQDITVRKMLVTASSEDGGHETEICAAGTITFTKSVSPDSLKESSLKSTPDKDSLAMDKDSLHSDEKSREMDSISDKSGSEAKEKVSPVDSLDKSPVGTRKSQDLEDSLEKKAEVSDEKSTFETASENTLVSLLEESPEKQEKANKVMELGELKSPGLGLSSVISLTESVFAKSSTEQADISAKTSVLEKPVEMQIKSFEEISKPTCPAEKLTDISSSTISEKNVAQTSTIHDEIAELQDKVDASKASSVVSEKLEEKDFPQLTGDKVEEKESSKKMVSKCQSSSIVSEKEASSSLQKLDDIITIEPNLAAEEIDQSISMSIVSTMSEEKETKSRTASISEGKPDDKSTTEQPVEKSRSASIVSAKENEKLLEKSQSTRIVSEKADEKGSPEATVRSRSTSISSDKAEEKSPSVTGDKVDEKDFLEEVVTKSRSSSITSEKTDLNKYDLSMSPGITSSKPSEKDFIDEAAVRSRAGSIASEKAEAKKDQEISGQSNSTSIAGDKPGEKDLFEEIVGTSRSSSIAGEKVDLKEDTLKSPGVSGEKLGHKYFIDETTIRSRSSSIASEKAHPVKDSHHDKESSKQLKSPRIAGDKPGDKELINEATARSRSSSIASEKAHEVKDSLLDEELSDQLKSPSIAGDKFGDQELIDEATNRARSTSTVSKKAPEVKDSHHDKEPSERIKSPCIADDKPGDKELIDEPTIRSRSSSIISEKAQPLKDSHLDKKPSDQLKSPSIGGDRPVRKHIQSRSSSIASEKAHPGKDSHLDKESSDQLNSPSIAGDKSGDKELIDEATIRSRSSSIASEKAYEVKDSHHDKEPCDRIKSPCIAADKLVDKELINEATIRSRSSSIASEKAHPVKDSLHDKEPSDLQKSPSIAGDKLGDKELIDEDTIRSRSSSIASEKALSVKDSHHDKESSDQQKSPSIAGDKSGGKELIDEPNIRSRSSSIASEKALSVEESHHEKETSDQLKSPSIAGDKKLIDEATIRSISSSIASEKAHPVKDSHHDKESSEQQKSPSIAGDKLSDKELIDKATIRSRSSSIASEKAHPVKDSLHDKEPSDQQKSPSIAGDNSGDKELIDEPTIGSRSSSIASEKAHPVKDSLHDKEPSDQQKFPSIPGDKSSDKELIDEATIRSRSSSIASEKARSVDDSYHDKELYEQHKSPSIAGDKLGDKELIDEATIRSRSSSISNEKAHLVKDSHHDKESSEQQKSPSIAGDKLGDKELIDEATIKSRSSSISSEKAHPVMDFHHDKEPSHQQKSPSIAGDKLGDKELIDDPTIRSRSSSIAKAKDSHHDKESSEQQKSPSIAVDKLGDKELIDEATIRSRSSSIASEKAHPVKDSLHDKEPSDPQKSPCIAADKLVDKELINEATIRSRSSSIASEKAHPVKDSLHDEELSDQQKSPSIAVDKLGDKELIDEATIRSRSSSIASEKAHPAKDSLHDKEPSDLQKSPSIAGDNCGDNSSDKELIDEPTIRSRSSSIASEKAHPVKDSLHDKEPSDQQKFPSIAGDKSSDKELIDEATIRSRSSSIASEKAHSVNDSHHDKESYEQHKSPSIAGDKLSDKELIDEATIRSRSSSISSEKAHLVKDSHHDKESSEQQKCPSMAGDKLGDKELIDEATIRSRSSSIASEKAHPVKDSLHDKEPSDLQKSPSIAGDKLGDKELIDEATIRSRSSSIASEKAHSVNDSYHDKESYEQHKSPSIAGDKLSDKELIDEATIRSRSSSISSEKAHLVKDSHHDKESSEQQKSPSIAGDKLGDKELIGEATIRSRSSSISSEKAHSVIDFHHDKEPSELLKTGSIAGDKLSDKELIDEATSRSRPSDITSEKAYPVKDSYHDKQPSDYLKYSGIVGETPVDKEVIDGANIRSRSSSIASEKAQPAKDSRRDQELSDQEKSPNITGDKSGIASEKSETKKPSDIIDMKGRGDKDLIYEATARSRSSSISGEEPDTKELYDKVKSAALTDKSDEKEAYLRPKSQIIPGDKFTEKDLFEDVMSSSFASENHDTNKIKLATADISDKLSDKGSVDRSRSPNVEGDKTSVKDLEDETDKSKLMGVASVKVDEKDISDQIKSATAEKTDEKEAANRSKSPSIAGDLVEEAITKSRTSSISIVKAEIKSTDPSKSPTIAGDELSEKGFLDDATIKSRSSSIVSDKQVIKKSVDPIQIIATDVQPDKKELADRSKSPSIVGEQDIEIDLVEVRKSRSSSIVSENLTPEPLGKPSFLADLKHDDKSEKDYVEHLRSASLISDKLDEDSIDRTKSPSTISEKSDEKDGCDRSKSSSIDGDKFDHEGDQAFTQSLSPSMIVEKLEHDLRKEELKVQNHDRSRTSSVSSTKAEEKISLKDSNKEEIRSRTSSFVSENPDEKISRSRTSSIVSEKGDGNEVLDKSRSPGVSYETEKVQKLDAYDPKLSRAESPIEDRTPKDRSRSHSLFEGGEKTPLGRSRAASVFEDKPSEKINLLDQVKGALEAPSKTNILEEKDEMKSSLEKLTEPRKGSLTVSEMSADVSEKVASRKQNEVEMHLLRRFSEEKLQIVPDVKDVLHLKPEEREEIESYVLNECVGKKQKVSAQMLDEMSATRSVSRSVIIFAIEEILLKLNIPRDTIIGFGQEEQEISHSERGDKSEELSAEELSAEKLANIEKYISEEYIEKHKKLSLEAADEIANIKLVSRSIIIAIVEEIILVKNLTRQNILESDILELVKSSFKEIDTITESQPTDTKSSGSKDAIVLPDSRESSLASIKDQDFMTNDIKRENIESKSSMVEQDFKSLKSVSKSPSPSPEPGTSVSRVSFQQSTDLLETQIPEEISISEEKRTEVKTLLLEDYISKGKKITETSLQEVINKTGVPRYIILEIIDEFIYIKKLSRENVIDKLLFLEEEPEDSFERSLLSTPDIKSSGYSTPEIKHLDEKMAKSIPYVADYESPFHKAFVGGMTEMRTTHITTLSGKSTPDLGGRADTPESDVTSTTGTTSQEVTEKKQEIKAADDQEISSTGRTVDKDLGPESEEDLSAVKTTVLKTTHLVSHFDQAESLDDLPTDAKREVIVYEEEPEILETVTTKTTTTVIIDEGSGDKGTTSEIGKPELYTYIISREGQAEVTESSKSNSEFVTKVISRESTPEITSDVKRIVTTVTTVTDSNGKVTTMKDVTESNDVLEREELLDKLIDSSQAEKSGKVSEIKTEVSKSDKVMKETATTLTTTSGVSTPDVKFFYDSGKSTPDSKLEEKLEVLDKISAERLQHSLSPLIKDLVSDDKSLSGKSSPDISLPKDIAYSGSTGKSTPDIPVSPLNRDGAPAHHYPSGRSTPDRRLEGRSRTSTPEGFRSGEVLRTIITTTRTMSDDGDIITTTKEVTEATNEKGETIVITEKTDVKVDDHVPVSMGSTIDDPKSADLQRVPSSGSDILSERDAGPISPRSDLSSGHSRAATHIWGSSEERHTYSDDEPPSSPLSTTSHIGHSPRNFEHESMISSFYGELPTSVSKTETAVRFSDPLPSESEKPTKVLTVEKEFASGFSHKAGSKKYIDEADLDSDKVLLELKDTRESTSTSTDSQDNTKDDKAESMKDPIEGWGTPLGLPSPKRPRKFNLRSPCQPSSSSCDLSPDSLNFDVISDWGEPLRLPSPAPVPNEVSNKGSPGTPKKERKQTKKVISENIKNKKRSESPGKNEKKLKDSKNKIQPVYMDLTYVPHHGNSYYTSLDFFKRIRARYYVFSGTEPSREVYDALLEAKKTWEDKDLEVTMIPTYDTDTLGYWVADNEEALAAHHIDLSPSASRCTINLQDHETSCSAYRLEF